MALAPPWAMRGRRLLWFALVVLVVVVTVYAGPSLRLPERIEWLASLPSARTAFEHPESGKSDALIALISVVIFTPIAAFFLVIAFLLLVRVFETFAVLVHLPAWVSAPVVGAVSIGVAYATTQLWLPPSLSTLGLIARAYVVYSSGGSPSPH